MTTEMSILTDDKGKLPPAEPTLSPGYEIANKTLKISEDGDPGGFHENIRVIVKNLE